MFTKAKHKALFLGAVVILLVLFPWITGNPYFLRIGISMFIYTPLALGVALLARSGQLTFAQYAFLGIGSYTVAIITTRFGWNWWLCLPLAGVVGGIMAVIVGYPALRIKGPYFAILTFGVNEILRLVITEWESLTGGSRGIGNIPPPSPLGGWQFGSMRSYYHLGLGLMLVSSLIVYLVHKSHFGLTLASTGQADTLSESVGVNVRAYKLKTFVAISVLAAVMGGFFAPLQQYISPLDFQIWESFTLVVFCVVGGMSSFVGPIYGILVLTIIPVVLQYVPGYDPVLEPLFYGTLVLLIVILYPGGIAVFLQGLGGRKINRT